MARQTNHDPICPQCAGPKIIRILREDFELNTAPSEYRTIETYVEQMLAYFVHPVKKGDIFVMRWLSGAVFI